MCVPSVSLLVPRTCAVQVLRLRYVVLRSITELLPLSVLSWAELTLVDGLFMEETEDVWGVLGGLPALNALNVNAWCVLRAVCCVL